MKSLLATLLAISTGTVILPAIANPNGINIATNNTSNTSDTINNATVSQTKTSANVSYSFAQRSLNIARQIPPDAIGFLVVDVDPRSWQIAATSSLNESHPLLAINKLLSFLSSSQYAIVKGTQLWLGTEVAIAFLVNPNPQEGVMFAAFAPISDDKQFEIFAKKLPDIYSKPTETLYQGVQILEWQLKDNSDKCIPKSATKLRLSNTESTLSLLKQAKPSKPDNQPSCVEMPTTETTEPNLPDFGFKRLAIAKLSSGYAVIASDRQAIQKMIDLSIANFNTKDANSQQPLPSLADQPLFLRSVNHPLWNRSLLAGYGDFKGIAQLTELFVADLPETSEIPGFSRAEYIQSLKYTLSQYNSFDLFTWLTPQGIRSQSNSYFSEVRSPLPKDQEPRDRLLSYLPSNIYGSITSRNLNRQWQWLVEESKVQSTYKIFVEGLRMLKPLIVGSGLELDIEKDVISWMDGEYAFVAFPSDRSPLQYLGLDLTFGALVRTSKPAAANAALAKFTKYLTKLGNNVVQVKKRQVRNVSLTSIEIPDLQIPGKTESIFAYGWRDPQTLMLTLGAPTASAFVPTAKPSLADSQMFREAIADMPQPNFGYFYLNVNVLAKLGAKFFLSEFMPNFDTANNQNDSPNANPELPEPIKKQIDKLGGAVFVYSETSDRFQADFFLGLKQ